MGHHDHHHHHGNPTQQPGAYGYYPPPPGAYPGYPPPPPPPAGYFGEYGHPQPFQQPYGAPPPPTPSPYSPNHAHGYYEQENRPNHAVADHHRHKRNEGMAEVGALAAGAFAATVVFGMKQKVKNKKTYRIELAIDPFMGAFHNNFNLCLMKKRAEHGKRSCLGYELHEVKADPEHANRHKMEAGAAGAVALGSAAYAFHEHREKKKDENLIGQYSGHNQSHHNHDHQHGKHHKFW